MEPTLTAQPTAEHAARLVEQALGRPVRAAIRFTTGFANYVFDVSLADGDAVVARLAATRGGLDGAAYWLVRLRALGVAVPRVLLADTTAAWTPFPGLVLERLPGSDLGHVLETLSGAQRGEIAAAVVAAQRAVHSLPLGDGYGYVAHPAGPYPHRTWGGVVGASLARSRDRIARAGVFSVSAVDRLEALLPRWDRYLAAIRPVAFLDDTTTKNVLVHDGRFSGIVDVDVVCYGDPLWTVALTRMALLSGDHALDYVDAWIDLLDLSDQQQRALDFYTTAFCADFMSEIGQTFNRAEALAADQARVARLNRLFADLTARLQV